MIKALLIVGTGSFVGGAFTAYVAASIMVGLAMVAMEYMIVHS